jgi:hypothetical protein
MIKYRQMGFHHLSTLPNYLRRGSGPPHTRGLRNTDKYHPSRASGSVGPKHWPGWDIAVGAHAPWNQALM